MSWKEILKSDDDHKKVLQMAKKVLGDLGLDEKFVDDKARDLANSEKLFDHISFSSSSETEGEMYSQVTEESLKDMIMADKGFYLPNLLNQDERFIQRKKETWDEDGHEILMELYEAIKQGASLPKWAVVKDGKLDDRATKEKYINEATRDRTSNSYVYWSIRD
tara:strand:+ start:8671 stop:9162 length:492 start_codon:yes stop_codon:yes gene_type:complete